MGHGSHGEFTYNILCCLAFIGTMSSVDIHLLYFTNKPCLVCFSHLKFYQAFQAF